MLNGQLGCCEGDVVVGVCDGALVDGVFAYVFTSDACWCSRQGVAANQGTSWNGDGECGVVVAVCFCLGYGCDGDWFGTDGEFGCCESDVVVLVGYGALVDGVFAYGVTSYSCECSGECV